MPAVSGSPTQLKTSVLTLADLEGQPDDAYLDGDFAYVSSTRATYQLDREASTTRNGSTVLSTYSGNGRWVFFASSSTWGYQATWYIDPLNGNDEHGGSTLATALRSWAEFTLRVSKVFQETNVYITSDLAESLNGFFLKGSSTATLIIQGVPTVLASGGGGAGTATFTDPVPGTNSRGSVSVTNLVTSAGVPTDFTSYVGKMLRSTQIDANGPFYWPILKATAGGPPYVAEGSWWTRASNSFTKPLADAAVEVLQLVTVTTMQIYSDGLPIQARYLKFTAASSSNGVVVNNGNLPNNTAGGFITVFIACDFGVWTAFACATTIIGCLWSSGSLLVGQGGSGNIVGGGSRGNLQLAQNARLAMTGFIIQGGKLAIGSGTASSQGGVVTATSTTQPLGVFDSASQGIEVIATGTFYGSNTFGSGNATYGLTVTTGGVVQLLVGTPPTITGTTAALLFNGAATAIPPPTAGAPSTWGNVSPLTTWVQWAAGPFNGYVMSYQNGSRIAGA